MGSARVQGELWGKSPHDWTYLQEVHHRPLFEAMLDAASVGQGTRILDVGCGGGGGSILASQRGARVTGLDAAAPLVEVARQRVPDAEFHTGDMEELPFADGSFDVVFAANAVQYAADRLAALRELRRVCAAAGRLVAGVFSVPERVEFRVIFQAVRESLPEPPPGDGPFGLSGAGVLEGLLEQAGFKLTGSGEVNCPFHYADFDTFWKATAAGGPTQRALVMVDAETLKANIRRAVEPFQRADGSIAMNGEFRFVVAVKD